jgi:tripartite ATP-independent transporter DctP family solute receptor
MFVRWLRSGVLALAFLVGFGLPGGPRPASAAEPIVVKLASAAPPNTPWDALLKEYKKNVEARSGGRLKVKLYLGASYADENDTLVKCKGGQFQAIGASVGAIASQVPELSVVEIPFLFRSFAEVDDVIDHLLTPAFEAITRESGLVLGFWSENGFRHFGTKDGFVKTPADLKGKKMRSQESQVHLEMYKNLGGSPVPVPTTEVMTALKNGTVDGFDQALVYMLAAGWHTTIKYVTLSSHIYQPSLVLFNRTWFDALPADLQTILIEEGRAIQAKGRTAVRAASKKQIKLLTDAGLQVYQLTDPERDVFEKATLPGRQSFRKTMGKRAAHLLDDVEAYLLKSRH